MSQDDERDNSLADDMLEPMRQRERERRGSALSDEARFSMIARGELHACAREECSRTVAHEGAEYCSQGCADIGQHHLGAEVITRHLDHGRSIDAGEDVVVDELDIPEDAAAPKCPTCDGTELIPHPCAVIDCSSQPHDPIPCPTCDGRTAAQAKRRAECTVCEGTGAVQCLPKDGKPGVYTWCAACAPPRPAPAPARDFDDLAAEYGFHAEVHPLPALVEANERANARLYPELPTVVVREGGKLVHRAPRSPSEARELEAEQRRITLKLTSLRSAGILIGWKGDHFSLAESSLDAIIQLVAERDDLKQRLHRAAARCTLTAETISSLAAGDEE